MSAKKTFADFNPQERGGPHGCRACGVPTAGTVAIQLRRKNSKGVNGPGPQLASKQMSFCEGCAIEVYEKLAAQFPAERAA